MRNAPTPPSTMAGIKRLAKSIKRELSVPHHHALDLAAGRVGYQNFRHAQNVLAQSEPTFHTYLSAYWSALGAGAGRETLCVALPKRLTEIIRFHEVRHARNLGWFKMESSDHLEYRHDLSSQQNARDSLVAAARTLRFMSATGLRPATTRKQMRLMDFMDKVPGRDHPSQWIEPHTGTWVYMDDPYPSPELEDRRQWADHQRVELLTPQWGGIYLPDRTIPHIFCERRDVAETIADALTRVKREEDAPTWDGESTGYFDHFQSPERIASGRRRSPRPMPSPYVKRGGALPYGASIGGKSSLWRPAKGTSLAVHRELGQLLGALSSGSLPGRVRDSIQQIRSTLDDWAHEEYRHDHSSTSSSDPYYGDTWFDAMDKNTQVHALGRVIALLDDNYENCAPLRQMLMRASKAMNQLSL